MCDDYYTFVDLVCVMMMMIIIIIINTCAYI